MIIESYDDDPLLEGGRGSGRGFGNGSGEGGAYKCHYGNGCGEGDGKGYATGDKTFFGLLIDKPVVHFTWNNTTKNAKNNTL